MSSSSAPTTRRTYGNWRRARGFGIGTLSPTETKVVFTALVVPALVAIGSGRADLALAVVGAVAVAVAVTVVKIDGQSITGLVARRLRFHRAQRAGWTELSGGLLTEHPRRHDLPGPLAPVVPLSTDDGRGSRQGLLWDRRTGTLTAVLRVSPVGLDLIDRAQADTWVAQWGAFLADLGYQPMIRHLSVTVDTSPTGGATLRDDVTARLDPAAPAAARAVMAALAAAAPSSAAEVTTYVALCFDPSRATPRPPDLPAAVAEVTRWLPGTERALAATGVAVLGRATTPWLTDHLRAAYDPAARADLAATAAAAAAGAAGGGGGVPPGSAEHPTSGWAAEWADAAPIRARESWDHWRHDSGMSVSWAMIDAPRQAVMDRILAPLLAPGPFARRTTLLYTPFNAAAAAAEVEREITHTHIRRSWARKTKRDETQRDRDDLARAIQTAREEAEGAGLGRFTLYTTTTVTDQTLLPAAVADCEQRAGHSKLRIRRLNGAHAAGFAAALGLGINPDELHHRH
ncbi:SCO6880 family protein [Pseudonocardia sp. ICBG1142]|uniref:SCO6880 family protein n=1 Tax=Pseudonocardia sp. ICBG1142 TaxID=2846760 RepID=UPI001CF66771|nr:SCO6880 family protein [Pseudonocardia sp. ICBG1142]